MNTSELKRSELLPLLVDAAVRIALSVGIEAQAPRQIGTHLLATFGDIKVLYRTPKAELYDATGAYGLDVWHGPKCFSVFWNSHQLKDYALISFKRGPWIPLLLAYAADLAPAELQ